MSNRPLVTLATEDGRDAACDGYDRDDPSIDVEAVRETYRETLIENGWGDDPTLDRALDAYVSAYRATWAMLQHREDCSHA